MWGLLLGLASAAALLLSLPEWDRSVLFWLNNLGRHLPLAAEWVTHLADHGWTAPLLVILLAKHPRLLAAALLAALLIHLSVRELKHFFLVLRPCFDPQLAPYVFTAGPNLRVDSYSFPSGHSATASLIAVSLVARWGKGAVWPALIFALLAGASRSLLGVHYPSDITTGLALGLAISAAVFYAAQLPAPAHMHAALRNPLPYSLGVWLVACALLVFILLAGQHNFPAWFRAVSKTACLLALAVVTWRAAQALRARGLFQ